MTGAEWCSLWWQERIADLERVFADGIPANFRSLPEVGLCGLESNDPAGYILAPEAANLTDAAHWSHLLAAGATDDVASIVEFGGGYGNTARLTRSFVDPPYHVLCDVPVLTRLQRHYLSSVGAIDGVGFVASDPTRIERCALYPDLLMATFSLDETTAACQEWWIGHEWMNARAVFVAMQRDRGDMFPDGPGLYGRLIADGFTEIECPFAGCVYLRKTRT